MSAADIDKVLGTVQTIALVWMFMHYLVPPLMTLILHNILGDRR